MNLPAQAAFEGLPPADQICLVVRDMNAALPWCYLERDGDPLMIECVQFG